MPDPPVFLLPAALRDGLLAYLLQRPYAEVAEGVKALQTLAPAAPTDDQSARKGAA